MKKVMIIDDDLVNRRLTSSYLENIGYEIDNILEFSNGLSAYDYIQKNYDIGLIVLDIFMPKMDGLEFLQKIKENINTKDIPVIIITTDDKLKNNDIVKLADDFLVRPVDFEQFIKTASYYLID